MEPTQKPLAWLAQGIKTPPFSREARLEAGFLLRQLQRGELLKMPQSRPMPGIGPNCHELRVRDESHNWRVIYRIDLDVIVIAAVFPKTTRATSKSDINRCKQRLRSYDASKKMKKGAGG